MDKIQDINAAEKTVADFKSMLGQRPIAVRLRDLLNNINQTGSDFVVPAQAGIHFHIGIVPI